MAIQRLAIFDIDGTIFRSSLLIELVTVLVAKKIFPREAHEKMDGYYVSWINRQGTYEAYIKKVVEVYRHYIQGCPERVLLDITDEVIESHKDKLYRFTRDLIPSLKNRGFVLLAVSGSPVMIVSKFARSMGFDDHRGNGYDVNQGIVTAAHDFASKREIVQSLVKKYDADMNQSIVVGDTEGDIPLLEQAGIPIAFNPNATLANYALSHDWHIIVERKDVIYDMKGCEVISEAEAFVSNLIPIS